MFSDRTKLKELTRVPFDAADIIASVQDLAKSHLSELGDGEKRRSFHFDRHTAFGLPQFDFGRRFPIDRVRSPGFAYLKWAMMLL